MAELIGWVDPVTIDAAWVEDATEQDVTDALAAAYAQCLAYRNHRQPVGPNDTASCVLAQKLQARALIRAGFSGDGTEAVGVDGLPVTIFPMDWTVKALLRPKRGKRYPR